MKKEQKKNLLYTIYEKLQGLSSYNLPDELKSDKFIIHNVDRSNLTIGTNTGPVKVSTITFNCILEDNSLLVETTLGTVDNVNTTLQIS